MSNNEMKNALAEAEARNLELAAELDIIENSEEYQTMKYVAAFADSDNHVDKVQLDEKTTVYELSAFGETYQIANEVEATAVKRAVSIANMEKGATLAKYAALIDVERMGAHVSIAKTIGEFAEKALGIARGTANDYIDTVKTFYSYNVESGKYEAISPLWKKASLTNLKQAKGTFNRVGKDRFVQYIIDGELHITGALPVLKKELKAIANEVPITSEPVEAVPESESTNIANANHSAEDGKGGEVKPAEVDTPKDRARFYLSKARADMLEVLEEESAKMEVCRMLDDLLKYLA